MSYLVYGLVKIWIRTGLLLYFGQIRIKGLENIPLDRPVLFLPNHQSALIDPLLIAVQCNRKPYFLTRSDVFKNPALKRIFAFFRMIPIYRIRDGRESLDNNQAIFDQCSHLLKNREAILMFPEANHNIKRRVRPLSKGFTRIVANTLEQYPDTDIILIPVGLNYANPPKYPDRAGIIYGKGISARSLWDEGDARASAQRVKEAVSEQLKVLTTHIADEQSYDRIVEKLNALDIDFLSPSDVNGIIADLERGTDVLVREPRSGISRPFKLLFECLNLVPLYIWRTVYKPKIKEPEFIATMRFAFAMLAYPVYCLFLFFLFSLAWGFTWAILGVLVLFAFNWAYVKWARP